MVSFKKVLSISAVSTALLFSGNSLLASTFNKSQREEIQKITHDYLNAHPEVLTEMVQKLRMKQQQQQQAKISTLQQKAPGIIRAHRQAFFDEGAPVVGNPRGHVTLIEFFDYRCGHCRSAAPAIESAIKQHHNLRVVYKELPIFKGDSQQAALAALAANEQGKYAAFHNALMKASQPLNKAKLVQVARSVGVDTKRMLQDMKDSALQKQLDENMTLAKDLLQDTVGYVFTPIIIVANQDATKAVVLPGEANTKALNQAIKQVG